MGIVLSKKGLNYIVLEIHSAISPYVCKSQLTLVRLLYQSL